MPLIQQASTKLFTTKNKCLFQQPLKRCSSLGEHFRMLAPLPLPEWVKATTMKGKGRRLRGKQGGASKDRPTDWQSGNQLIGEEDNRESAAKVGCGRSQENAMLARRRRRSRLRQRKRRRETRTKFKSGQSVERESMARATRTEDVAEGDGKDEHVRKMRQFSKL